MEAHAQNNSATRANHKAGSIQSKTHRRKKSMDRADRWYCMLSRNFGADT